MPPQSMVKVMSSSDDEMLLDAVNMASKSNQDDLILGVEPHDHDVLCGRGGNINIHPGNARFREKVESRKRCYIDARFKREKRLIAESIIKDIKRLDPPGRFLTRENKDGPWYEISDEKARDKTSQALRENAPKIRQQIQHEKDRAEAQKMAEQRRNEFRNQRGGHHGRDFEPIRYDNIMSTMASRFGCPGSLEAFQDQYHTPRRDMRHDMHDRDGRDYGRRDTRKRPQYTYDYEPNEYGLPGPHHPNSRERTPELHHTYSYRPNEYGLPPRRDGNNPNLEQTYSYKPNEYGHRDERNADQRYAYRNHPDDYHRHNSHHPAQQDDAWRYRNPQTPQSRPTDSDEYSDHLLYTSESSPIYPYGESRPMKRARENDDSALNSFVNSWTGNEQHNSREDVLALMDSLSMDESDRGRNSDDPRTPPPEEYERATSPDWMPGCHFNDAVRRAFYGDEAASPIQSIDMDDQSSSTRSLNGATLVNVFEEGTRNIRESTRNMKESMMSLGDSFFNSMNFNFSTEDDL